MQESTAWRLRVFSGQLAGTSDRSPESLVREPCRAEQPAQIISRFCSCDEALECIQDGDSVAVSLGFARHVQCSLTSVDTGLSSQVAGFVGCGSPEHLLLRLRAKYDVTSHPSNLDVYVGAPGGKGRGIELIAADGLLRSLTYGWLGLSPKLLELVMQGKIEAWNFPLGISMSFQANPPSCMALALHPRQLLACCWPILYCHVYMIKAYSQASRLP